VTPGPVVITATFVGYILKGLIGGAVATASIFLPSFILVISTAPFLAKFNSSPLFRRAVDGILCSFVGLLACTAIRMGFAVSWTLPRILLSVAALTALLLRVDMLWIVLAGAGISVLIR
jgi:chromate transporter